MLTQPFAECITTVPLIDGLRKAHGVWLWFVGTSLYVGLHTEHEQVRQYEKSELSNPTRNPQPKPVL
ncbi:hypothetical protein D3C80_49990 [compost metagenome]